MSKRTMLLMLSVIAALVVGWQVAAFASHPEASLPGSNFEIDTDANLKVDDPAPSTDWAGVTEIRATDKPTGPTDDSYEGGVKEDTVCPGEVDGSIPNNKSDLRTFHVYREPGSGGHPGFLNLAWSRVNNPTGTTLMNFEFNQSSTNCTTGPNKVRTVGDLLIEYSIDQGGSRADITARTWTGSAWGPAQDLDVPSPTCGGNPCASGTINSSTIPAAESDGLISTGSLAARTFGEAQIDLRLIFQADKCTSFGSAMLKSRSSDAGPSQLKDFIRPVGINLTNCGKVVIRKETIPDEDPNTTDFGYTKSFGTDPVSANTFTLKDDASKEFTNVLFGSGHTVVEDVIPANWALDHVDCSASSGVTPSINGATVTFAIDADTDVLDCTYYNKKLEGALRIIKEDDADPAHPLAGAKFNLLRDNPPPGGSPGAEDTQVGSCTTDVNGECNFAGLTPGDYWVVETEAPPGHDLPNPAFQLVTVLADDTVTVTFVDPRQRGAIEITKTRKHAADGPGDHPHSGVTFTVTGGELPAAGVTAVTDANGKACVDGLLFDDYTVTETVPANYRVTSDNPQTATVDNKASCTDNPYGGETVSFHNTPLTNITLSVDSQVDGGTASTIDCGGGATGTTGPNGDGSVSRNDLEPGTYTCTVVVDP